MSNVWDSWPKELPKVHEIPELQSFHELTSPDALKNIAILNRKRAIEAVTKQLNGNVDNTAIVIMGGKGEEFQLYCTDTEAEFRQERFFLHLFNGATQEPGMYGILNLASKESSLYIQPLPASAVRWQGPNRPFQYYKDIYGVDHVNHVENILSDLTNAGIKKILVLKGINTDSGSETKTTATFEGIESFEVDSSTLLYDALVEVRMKKTDLELDLVRKACKMSAQAHTYVMRHVRPGMSEFHAEALFKAYTAYYGGARFMAYTCICGAGHNGSVLHYGHSGYPNNKMLKDGDMFLCDMGAEYGGYATDLTRSYPVNGKFTDRQRQIYNIVAECQQAVYAEMKAGVEWRDLHLIAERVIVTRMLELGIFVDATVDELMDKAIAGMLMPHGLGHSSGGMSVHDVVKNNPKSDRPGLCWLRLDRKLEAGFVVTVEPGVYFNESWIEEMLKDENIKKHVNVDLIRSYYDFGGIRLEDDILVTENGYENLSGVWPTTADEVEALMVREN